MCVQFVALLVILAAAETSANRRDEAADSTKDIATQDTLTEKIAQEIEAEQKPTTDRAEEKAFFQAKQSARIAQHDAQVVAFKIAQLTKKGMEPENATAVVRKTVLVQDKAEEKAHFQAKQSARIEQHDAQVVAFKIAQLTKKGMEPENANAVVRKTVLVQDKAEEKAHFQATQSANLAQHEAQVVAFKIAQLTKKGMEPEKATAVVKKALRAQKALQVAKNGKKKMKTTDDADAKLKARVNDVALFRAKKFANNLYHDALVAERKNEQLVKKGLESEVPTIESEVPTIESEVPTNDRALEMRKAEEDEIGAAELRTAALKGLAVWGAVALAKDLNEKRHLRAQMFPQNVFGR